MHNDHYILDDFDFELPAELIAQYPIEKRDNSRLFVLQRSTGEHIHSTFSLLPSFLHDGDVLVFNNAKVINARIQCRRGSGGAVEVLLTGRHDARRWDAITNRTKRLEPGETIYAENDRSISFTIISRTNEIIQIESNRDLDDSLLSGIGSLALPPYIKREVDVVDRDRYQTVFASESGAVAAPTAGLHFTEELLNEIRKREITMAYLTLLVSWGTFQPVRVSTISEHRMHKEKYYLGDETAEIINNTRKRGGRIIAVGTTSLRVLESTFAGGVNIPGSGETDIFIYPPHRISSVNSLITNFHTPKSTLLMLVSAFAGYENIMGAYRKAVQEGYRFFSYGDSMLII